MDSIKDRIAAAKAAQRQAERDRYKDADRSTWRKPATQDPNRYAEQVDRLRRTGNDPMLLHQGVAQRAAQRAQEATTRSDRRAAERTVRQADAAAQTYRDERRLQSYKGLDDIETKMADVYRLMQAEGAMVDAYAKRSQGDSAAYGEHPSMAEAMDLQQRNLREYYAQLQSDYKTLAQRQADSAQGADYLRAVDSIRNSRPASTDGLSKAEMRRAEKRRDDALRNATTGRAAEAYAPVLDVANQIAQTEGYKAFAAGSNGTIKGYGLSAEMSANRGAMTPEASAADSIGYLLGADIGRYIGRAVASDLEAMEASGDADRAREAGTMYAYLSATRGKNYADRYWDAVRATELEATAKAASDTAQKYATESPVGASLSSVVGQIEAAAPNLFAVVKQAASTLFGIGEDVGASDSLMAQQRRVNDTREAVEAGIDSNAGKFAYRTAMSLADNGVRIALNAVGVPIWVTELIAAGTAAGTTMQDVIDKGGSPDKALTLGIVSALAEAITERIGVDVLFDAIGSGGRAAVLKAIGKAIPSEALEETMSEGITLAADALVMGSESDLRQSVDAYKAQGDSDAQAVAKTVGTRLGEAALGGAIAGGVFGGAGASIKQATTPTIVKQGMRAERGSAYRQAADVAYKTGTGRDPIQRMLLEAVSDAQAGDPVTRKALVDASGGKLSDADAVALVDALQNGNNKRSADLTAKGGLTEEQIGNAAIAGERAAKLRSDVRDDLRTDGVKRSANKVDRLTESIYKAAYNGKLTNTETRALRRDKASTALVDKYKALVDSGGDIEPAQNRDTISKIASESKISTDGKASVVAEDGTTAPISIDSVRISDGQVQVVTDDGTTFDPADVTYADDVQAYTIAWAAQMGADATHAYQTISALPRTGGDDPLKMTQRFTAAYEWAHYYGMVGTSEQRAMDSSLTQALPEEQRLRAYEAGRILADTKIQQEIKIAAERKRAVYKGVDASKVSDKTMSSLTADQTYTLAVADLLSKAGKVNIVVMEAMDKGYNGGYQASTNTIMLNINAFRAGQTTGVRWTLAHELTHFAKAWAPAEWDAYKAAMLKVLEDKGTDIARLTEHYKQLYAKHGQQISDEDALEEVICQGAQEMLENSKYIEQLAREDKTLLQKILDALKKILDAVNRLVTGKNPDPTALAVQSEVQNLVEQWDAALKAALERSAGAGTDVTDVTEVTASNNVKAQITPEEDRAYAEAVRSGDMITAQKMVDTAARKAGYTIKAYHGTPNGTFNVFSGWQYFTPNQEYADRYQSQSASSISYKPTADAPRTYSVFLKTDKPFDTRKPKERRIFENEFYRQWGDGSPLSDRGLPDWVDGYDFPEFFEENGYEYDVVYLDEGGDGGYGEAVKDRGVSIVVKNPSQIKSADPAVYDDNGNLVPLSERFDPKKDDIRWQIPYIEDDENPHLSDKEARFSKNSPNRWLNATHALTQSDHSRFKKMFLSSDVPLAEDLSGTKVYRVDNNDDTKYALMRDIESIDEDDQYDYLFVGLLVVDSGIELNIKFLEGALESSDIGFESLFWKFSDAFQSDEGVSYYSRRDFGSFDQVGRRTQGNKPKTGEILGGTFETQNTQRSNSDIGKGGYNERRVARSSKRDRDINWSELSEEQTAFFSQSKVRSNWEGTRARYNNGKGYLLPVYELSEDKGYGSDFGYWFNSRPIDGKPMYLNVQKPYNARSVANLNAMIERYGIRNFYERLVGKGYDGIVLRDAVNRGLTFAVFDLTQAVDVNNKTPGIVSASDSDTKHQLAPTDSLGLTAEELLASVDPETIGNKETRRLLTEYQTLYTEYKGKLDAAGGNMKGLLGLRDKVHAKMRLKALQDLESRVRAHMTTEAARYHQAEVDINVDWYIAEQTQKYGKKIDELTQKYRDMLVRQRDRKNDQILKESIRASILKQVKAMHKLLVTDSKEKHVPQDMKNAVARVLEVFAADAKIVKAQDIGELAYLYQQIQAETGDDALYNPYIEETISKVQKALYTKKFTDLTVEELQELRDAVKSIRALITGENKLFGENQKLTLQESWDKAMFDMESVPRRRLQSERFRKAESLAKTGNMKPVYFFRMLGGEMERLFQTVLDGQAVAARDMFDDHGFIKQVQDKYHYEEWGAFSKGYKKDLFEYETPSGDKLTLTREQAMYLYATAKREQQNERRGDSHLSQGGWVYADEYDRQRKKSEKKKNLRPDLKGHPMSDKDMKAVSDWLTDEQKAYADAMVEYLSSTVGGRGNKVSMALYNIKIFGEKYYFPYRVSEDSKSLKPGEYGSKVQNANLLTAKGFTHQVAQNASSPIVVGDFTDAVADHMSQMATYHGEAIPQLNLWRVLNYKNKEHTNGRSLKTAIREAYGENAMKYIDLLLADLNGQIVKDPREELGALVNYKYIQTAAKISVALQQPTAVIRAMAYVPPKYFVAKPISNKAYEELLRYSGTAVIKSIGGFDLRTGRGAADWIANKPKDASDHFNTLAEEADKRTWTLLWGAVKAETKAKTGLAEGSEELLQAAGKRFDEVVELTQVYDSVLTRSQVMRSKNAFVNMITAYMAEPTVTLNMVLDLVTSKSKLKPKKGAVLLSVAMSIITTNLLKSIWQAAGDDDEERTYAEKLARTFVGNVAGDFFVLNYIPILKDIVSLVRGYDVERMDMAPIADLVDSLKKLYDGVFVKDVTPAEMVTLSVNAMANIANILGVPATNITRDVRTVVNIGKQITSGSDESTDLSTIAKDALSEITIGLYDSSSTGDYDRLYRKIKQGKTAEYEAHRKGMIEYEARKLRADGVSEKQAQKKAEAKVDNKMKQRIRADYESGKLTFEESEKLLRSYALTDEEDIYFTSKEWEYEQGSDDQYSRYGELYAAMDAGKNVTAFVKELTSHGYKEEDVLSSMKSHIGSLYREGELTRTQAEQKLSKYVGEDEHEIFWSLDRWDYTIAHNGDSDGYSKYLRWVEAVRTGKNLRETIRFYVEHDVDKKALAAAITREFKKEYLALKEKGKASTLKGYLLNAYARLYGADFDRAKKSKDIDNWKPSEEEED